MKISTDMLTSEFKKGNPIILFDSEKREGEADLIFHAKNFTAKQNYVLRTHAGGAIVLAIGQEIARKLELPYLHDVFKNAGVKNTYIKTNYADTPPYTLPVNHIKAHTGVTDNDRSLAIREFETMYSMEDPRTFFLTHFRTPGHLPICLSKGIENRRGHTELSIALAKKCGLSECMVLCEMLKEGTALSKLEAQEVAKSKKLLFIEGRDVDG